VIFYGNKDGLTDGQEPAHTVRGLRYTVS